MDRLYSGSNDAGVVLGADNTIDASHTIYGPTRWRLQSKVKGKVHPRTGHGGPGGSKRIALLFLYGPKKGWMINATHRPLYPCERPCVHCTGGWVGPRAVWTDVENRSHTGIRSPDRPARSLVAIPTELSQSGLAIVVYA